MWIDFLRIGQHLQELTADGVAINPQCNDVPLIGKGSVERAVISVVQSMAATALRATPAAASSPVSDALRRIAATLPQPLTSTKAIVGDTRAHDTLNRCRRFFGGGSGRDFTIRMVAPLECGVAE